MFNSIASLYSFVFILYVCFNHSFGTLHFTDDRNLVFLNIYIYIGSLIIHSKRCRNKLIQKKKKKKKKNLIFLAPILSLPRFAVLAPTYYNFHFVVMCILICLTGNICLLAFLFTVPFILLYDCNLTSISFL
jgi:hypothetical protein